MAQRTLARCELAMFLGRHAGSSCPEEKLKRATWCTPGLSKSVVLQMTCRQHKLRTLRCNSSGSSSALGVLQTCRFRKRHGIGVWSCGGMATHTASLRRLFRQERRMAMASPRQLTSCMASASQCTDKPVCTASQHAKHTRLMRSRLMPSSKHTASMHMASKGIASKLISRHLASRLMASRIPSHSIRLKAW